MSNNLKPVRLLLVGVIALSCISLTGCVVDRDRDHDHFHDHDFHDHDFHDDHHDRGPDYHGMSQPPRDIVAMIS
jgi:hypothetical protein